MTRLLSLADVLLCLTGYLLLQLVISHTNGYTNSWHYNHHCVISHYYHTNHHHTHHHAKPLPHYSTLLTTQLLKCHSAAVSSPRCLCPLFLLLAVLLAVLLAAYPICLDVPAHHSYPHPAV